MEGILALSIPLTFLIVIGLTTKWLSDNRVRRELLNAGSTPEQIEAVMQNPVQDIDSSLKWGIVSMAIGLSLVGIHIFDLDAEDPLTFALVFLFGGAGLIAFYVLCSRGER